jgi:hypothetical protein
MADLAGGHHPFCAGSCAGLLLFVKALVFALMHLAIAADTGAATSAR